MGMQPVDITEIKAGDMVTLQGGKWGHIALVSEVGNRDFNLLSQNLFNDARDLKLAIGYADVSNIICNQIGAEFSIEGFLRLP